MIFVIHIYTMTGWQWLFSPSSPHQSPPLHSFSFLPLCLPSFTHRLTASTVLPISVCCRLYHFTYVPRPAPSLPHSVSVAILHIAHSIKATFLHFYFDCQPGVSPVDGSECGTDSHHCVSHPDKGSNGSYSEMLCFLTSTALTHHRPHRVSSQQLYRTTVMLPLLSWKYPSNLQCYYNHKNTLQNTNNFH